MGHNGRGYVMVMSVSSLWCWDWWRWYSMWFVWYGSACSTIDGDCMCDMAMIIICPLHISLVWAPRRGVIVGWVGVQDILRTILSCVIIVGVSIVGMGCWFPCFWRWGIQYWLGRDMGRPWGGSFSCTRGGICGITMYIRHVAGIGYWKGLCNPLVQEMVPIWEKHYLLV